MEEDKPLHDYSLPSEVREGEERKGREREWGERDRWKESEGERERERWKEERGSCGTECDNVWRGHFVCTR